MKRIDGIIAVPKGLKREARRLVAVAFMLAPIGALSAVAAVGVNGKTASNLTPSPAAPASQAAAPSLASPTTPPVADQGVTSSNKASSSVELHTTQSASGNAPTTELKVNQQAISLPSTGTVHKVISNDNGTTTIDVSHSSTSINDNSSSSTSIQLNTSSSTTTNSQSDTGP